MLSWLSNVHHWYHFPDCLFAVASKINLVASNILLEKYIGVNISGQWFHVELKLCLWWKEGRENLGEEFV